jgi:hypothetical protein
MSASPLDSLQNIVGAAEQHLAELDENPGEGAEAAAQAFFRLVAAIVAEAGWLSADPAVSADLRARCVHLMRRYAQLHRAPEASEAPKPL